MITREQIEKTTAEWESQNPTLADNVIGVEIMSTGYLRYKRGNGVSVWKSLPYLDKIPPTEEAAKIAANFLEHTTANGLLIGDKTSGQFVGYRAQVLSDALNILDDNGNKFASFKKDGISLGADLNVSGKIRGTTEGVSWYKGRDAATLIATGGTGTSAYFPVIDTKCNTGDWSMGCLGDSLYFVFTTNANYNAENNTTAKLCIDSSGHIKQSGYNVPSLKYENNYWGLGLHNGENADWIRTPSSGLIPYKSGGSSSLGTIGWPFSSVYTGIIGSADTIYFRAYQDKGYGQILIGAQGTDRGLELKPVTNNTCSLGCGSGRWKWLFVRNIDSTYAVSVTSDRRLKKDISYDLSVLDKVIDNLNPVIYRMNGDEEEKLRFGFIAQDAEQAFIDAGLNPDDYAFITKTETDDGEMLGLGYTETNALLWHRQQQLEQRIVELEKRIA